MIRRFDNDEGASEMYECDDGTYVTYEDHVAEIEKYKELAKAAWKVGYATAKAVYERDAT